MSEKKEKVAEATTKEKAKEKVAATEVMYVGPTVPGIAIQNTVYTAIPDGALAAAETLPVIKNLFIQITDYPKAQRMLREKKGYIYSAYEKALEYKGGVKK